MREEESRGEEAPSPASCTVLYVPSLATSTQPFRPSQWYGRLQNRPTISSPVNSMGARRTHLQTPRAPSCLFVASPPLPSPAAPPGESKRLWTNLPRQSCGVLRNRATTSSPSRPPPRPLRRYGNGTENSLRNAVPEPVPAWSRRVFSRITSETGGVLEVPSSRHQTDS